MPNFIHNDPDFSDLLETVAAQSFLKSVAMVEKDYWITHTLWALHRTPLKLVFKGGTALSKGFRITNRFSEDIDLVVDHTAWVDLPTVENWHGSGKQPSTQRKVFWEEVISRVSVPGVQLTIDADADETFRNVKAIARYPGRHTEHLAHATSPLRPYVLVELTHNDPERCSVAPATVRPITSSVHEFVVTQGLMDGGDYIDTRLPAVTCVHPLITLLEKLDAITRRFPRRDLEPAAFARHYEDAARVILRLADFGAVRGGHRALARAMHAKHQLRTLVRFDDAALNPTSGDRWAAVSAAHAALASMFWAPQMPLSEATRIIREWLAEQPLTDDDAVT